MNDLHHWLLKSDEPWTRYLTMIDLLDIPLDDPGVGAARGIEEHEPLACRDVDDAVVLRVRGGRTGRVDAHQPGDEASVDEVACDEKRDDDDEKSSCVHDPVSGA